MLVLRGTVCAGYTNLGAWFCFPSEPVCSKNAGKFHTFHSVRDVYAQSQV